MRTEIAYQALCPRDLVFLSFPNDQGKHTVPRRKKFCSRDADTKCGWGDAAAIRRQDGRKQKHDRRDARLILKLMEEQRFLKIWIQTVAERDVRQLLMHRQHLVRMRTRIKNQLQPHSLAPGLAEEAQAVE